MEGELRTNININKYSSKLIKYLSDDCIGIVLVFVLWDPQIGDLVSAQDPKYGRNMYWYDGIIFDITICNNISLYHIHYIGWIAYSQKLEISRIILFTNNYKWHYHGFDYNTYLSKINKRIKELNIHKVILIIHQNKKISRDIITNFPLTYPKYRHLCSDIQIADSLYLFSIL